MYSFFLDGLRLPVTPERLDTNVRNKNKTVTLLSGDEINILKSPGLTEINFTMMIPSQEYPFARYDGGFKSPEFFLTRLETLKASKEPFPFIVSRIGQGGQLLYETNIRVALEDYSISESADFGTDLMIKVKLKQYRDYGTKKAIITVLASSAVVKAQDTKERPAKAEAKTYTVKSGDTLWAICRKELGDGSRYPEIAKLNKIPNPNRIFPGQVIRFG